VISLPSPTFMYISWFDKDDQVQFTYLYVIQISIITLISDNRKERKFKVTIRLASKTDLYHLKEFLQGRQRGAPHDTIQVLDVVLRESPSNKQVSQYQ